jgi:hypothetical protein
VIDHIIGMNERERRLVMKVLSLTLHLLMRLGQELHRFTPAMAPLLALRDTPLRRLERSLSLALPARRKDAHAIGEGGEGLDPQVDASFLPRGGQGLYWLAKTHLQHILTAVTLNLGRLSAWLEGKPLAPTRQSTCVRLVTQGA